MEVLILILPIALLISAGFVVSFIISVKNGQYDDLETPAYRVLLDENDEEKNINKTKSLGD